jgi:uncharacterized protein (TIGR03083 family)
MHDADHIAALIAANDILRATDPADLGRDVSSCPGWTVQDLIEHIAQVQRWATRIVLAPPGERVERRIESPDGPAIIDWFADGADALVHALTTVDLDHDVYAFVGTRPARWWVRRQAQEATVHAWDRQLATGTPDAIDAAVAADGIDELLSVLLVPRLVDTSGFAATGESVHVHTTDVDGEWLLRVAPDSIELTREHAKGDVALRGPASDALLVLWGRRPVDETDAEAFGSVDLLERLLAAADL